MAPRTAAQQRKAFEALLKKLEPTVAKAFLDAVNAAAGAVDLGALTEAIKNGKIEEAVRIIQRVQALYFPLDDAIRSAYIAGGQFVAGGLGLMKNPLNGNRVLISFDGRHPRAEAWTRSMAGTLIEGINAQQIQMVRTVVAAGLQAGRHSSAIALDIVGRKNLITGKREGGFLGLNSGQTDTLITAWDDLSSGDPKRLKHYLSLKSRDRRFDAIVNKAIKDGTKIPTKTIDAISQGHKSKMLLQRGKTIAKDQAHTALASGQHEGWAQLIESGAVKAEDVTKRWQHNLNIPARPDHQAMSGTVVTFNQPFKMPDNTLMQHDHDPAGGPKNNLHCHCYTFYRLRKGRDV